MLKRLKSMLSVLLALAVCGASSQAAVCALSCGLDAQGKACHMAATSQPAAMPGMPHGHCASESESAKQAAFATDRGASLSSLHGAGCRHSFSLAVEDAARSKVRAAVAYDTFSEATLAEELAYRCTDLPYRRPPPFLASANSLLISLRI